MSSYVLISVIPVLYFYDSYSTRHAYFLFNALVNQNWRLKRHGDARIHLPDIQLTRFSNCLYLILKDDLLKIYGVQKYINPIKKENIELLNGPTGIIKEKRTTLCTVLFLFHFGYL